MMDNIIIYEERNEVFKVYHNCKPFKIFYIKTSEREDLCERHIGYEINT